MGASGSSSSQQCNSLQSNRLGTDAYCQWARIDPQRHDSFLHRSRGHFLTNGERLNGGRLVEIFIGFSGVVYIIGPQVLKGIGANTLAQLAVLGAATSYAFAAVFGRRFRRMGLAPIVTAAGQVTAATVVLIPLALFVDRPWMLPLPSWEIWGAVVGLALFFPVP